jgi:apolipoprotein N-acyltransferase
MATETCASCKRAIPDGEPACVFEGEIVCPVCDDRLRLSCVQSEQNQKYLADRATTRRLAIASLILGICAIPASLLCIGFVLGPIAVVLGVIALDQNRKSGRTPSERRMAIVGIIMGGIAPCFLIGLCAVFVGKGWGTISSEEKLGWLLTAVYLATAAAIAVIPPMVKMRRAHAVAALGVGPVMWWWLELLGPRGYDWTILGMLLGPALAWILMLTEAIATARKSRKEKGSKAHSR